MIERAITPTMLDAAKASPSRLLAFCELEYPSGWVRVHSGHGERIYNGQTYLGLGEFAGITAFSENAASSANRLTLSLKVLDQSLLAEVMNENATGYDCYIHLVAYDEHRRIIDGVDYIIDGEIVDTNVIRGNSEKQIPALIKLSVADWMERWSQPVDAAKTTDAAQQHLYPGDRFFDLVEVISGSPLSSLPTKSFDYGRHPRRGVMER